MINELMDKFVRKGLNRLLNIHIKLYRIWDLMRIMVT